MKQPRPAITPAAASAHLNRHVQFLCNPRGAVPFSIAPDWASAFPKEPGVYAVFQARKLIYVGETGDLRGRMKDLGDTRNHTLRRQIGRQFGKGGSSRKKFPLNTEKKLDRFMTRRLSIKVIPVALGRKEIEEELVRKRSPIYNRKGRRGAKR